MNTALTLQIGGDISKLRAELNKANGLMNGFKNQLTSIGSAMGLTFGAATVFQGLRYGFTVIKDFEKSMSEVRSITNATDAEFEALTRSAMELGRTTLFTAKQVSELQVAFGRLGFSNQEILDSTAATLQLATATGEDLAKSADIAGSTLRSFNLDAKEMQRVVDVMAASFNKSALGLDNFGESMKYVAPIASAAGISIEETTAMLGVLADAGIRGSMAGTSLRKIISDVGGETGTLSEKLQKLADKGLSGADAMDEVGRTAYASLLILAKHVDKVNDATVAYQNASGEAQAMADLMSDNLAGDITKLTSAVDGLILEFREGSGPIRDVVQALTELIGLVSSPASLNALKLFIAQLPGFREAKLIADIFKDDPQSTRASQPLGPDTPSNPLGMENFVNIFIEDAKKLDTVKQKIKEVIELSETAKRAMSGAPLPDQTYSKAFGPIPVDTNAMFSRMEALRMKSEETTTAISENWLDLSGNISNALSTVADGLGQAVMGVGNFGDTILKALAGFAKQIGEMLIGIGVGMLAARMAIKNPFTAIAAGVALVALSGMMSAGMSQAQGNFNSGGGGGGSPGRLPSEVNVSGRSKIKGYDLEIVHSKESYRRGWSG